MNIISEAFFYSNHVFLCVKVYQMQKDQDIFQNFYELYLPQKIMQELIIISKAHMRYDFPANLYFLFGN